MDQRRRKTREKMLKDQLEEMRKKNPKITETFADLKRDIREMMSLDDWEVSLTSVAWQQILFCYAFPWPNLAFQSILIHIKCFVFIKAHCLLI